MREKTRKIDWITLNQVWQVWLMVLINCKNILRARALKVFRRSQAGPNFMDLYIMVAWNLNETCVFLQSCVYIGSRDSDGPITTTLENLRNLSIQNWELRFLICCWDSKVRTGLAGISNSMFGNVLNESSFLALSIPHYKWYICKEFLIHAFLHFVYTRGRFASLTSLSSFRSRLKKYIYIIILTVCL